MAKIQFEMPDGFLEKVSKLGSRFDDVAKDVLNAGGEVVLDKVKSNLRGVIGKGTKEPSRSTGELVSSLGLSPARMDKNGNFDVKIGFREPRADGESNAKIANILEYGKHGQPARPFLKPAKTASKAACIAAMEQKLKEAIE